MSERTTRVYLCRCGRNIADKMDLQTLARMLGEREGVDVTTVDMLCSEEGKESMAEDLASMQPGRVVVAACSPRDHEITFRGVMSGAGLNPYHMQMVNVREHVAWVTPDVEVATQKAHRLVLAAIARVGLHEALEPRCIDVNSAVAVIGAGPAGMKAAEELARAGRQVYLIEKSPAIGGLPVLFEEVFPAMECGSCMLEPVMGEVLHGELAEHIMLMSMSEVTSVKGYMGNFMLTVSRRARRIDMDTCIGCGECTAACPVECEDELAPLHALRKAVHVPYTGALPNVPCIDPATCLRFKGEDCTACLDACPIEGTVLYDQADETVELNVGAVIVATGGALFDHKELVGIGEGTAPGVIDALTFERLMASNGPTGGVLPEVAGEPPSSFCIVHCAGSLDERYREYCSGICCRYAFKFNRLIEERFPEAKILHLYKQIAVPGKAEAMLYRKARENPGARFVRYVNEGSITLTEECGSAVVSYDHQDGEAIFTADYVILCPAMVPGESTGALSGIFEIPLDSYGFFEEMHSRIDPARSKIRGVYVAGACVGPVDIRDAMSQGAAAAGCALSDIVEGRQLEISPVTAVVDADTCSGCLVCVGVCPYRAIHVNEETRRAEVSDLLCQGCGTCVAACPSGSMRGRHFTKEEIMAEIEGLLS